MKQSSGFRGAEAAAVCGLGYWRRGNCREKEPQKYEKSSVEPLVRCEVSPTPRQNIATVGLWAEWKLQKLPNAQKRWNSDQPVWGELSEHPVLSYVASDVLGIGLF